MTPRQHIVHHLRGHPLCRAADLLALPGVNRRGIQNALAAGAVERPAYGVYAAPGVVEAVGATDLEHAVACLVTGGVVCGPSAAAYHGLNDDLPAHLHVLVPRAYTHARGEIGLQLVRSTIRSSFTLGIEERKVLGVTCRVTNPARTVVDLYRLDAVPQHMVEALRSYLADHNGSLGALRTYARPFNRRHLASLNRLWTDAEAILATLDKGIRP